MKARRLPSVSLAVKRIVEESETRAGRWFDLFIMTLIVVSVVDTSVETLPGLSAEVSTALSRIEHLIVMVFTLEYLARLWVADRRIKFMTSFHGVIDLVAILPFYLSTGLDLRAARALRLFRLVRVLKLARYSAALDRLGKAFVYAREELVLFFFASAMVVFFASIGIYYFENPVQPEHFASVYHSMWWALTTLTTVGYGDMVPMTIGGRFFTAVVLAVGLGVVAVPSGIVAAALTEIRSTTSPSSVDVPDKTERASHMPPTR